MKTRSNSVRFPLSRPRPNESAFATNLASPPALLKWPCRSRHNSAANLTSSNSVLSKITDALFYFARLYARVVKDPVAISSTTPLDEIEVAPMACCRRTASRYHQACVNSRMCTIGGFSAGMVLFVTTNA